MSATIPDTDHTNPYAVLWLEVILRAVADATGRNAVGSDSPDVRATIRRRSDVWFNPTDKDFRMVCNLAGLSPEAVAESYRGGRTNISLRQKRPTAGGTRGETQA